MTLRARAIIPLPIIVAASILLFGAVVFRLAGVTAAVKLSGGAIVALLLAALFYVVSHSMRAIRLSVIAMPLLGVSFRTAISVHFSVAPWSLLAPFKLDELIRLHELNRVGRAPIRAVATVLIDRSMDGLVLVLLAIYLLLHGRGEAAGVALFAGAALTALALGIIILPLLLETIQRHIFIYNFRNSAVFLLRSIDRLRQLLLVSRQTIAGAAPFLFVCTIGIWAIELLAIACVLKAMAAQPVGWREAVELMLTRVDNSWRYMFSPSARPLSYAAAASALFFVALLVPWTIATTVYLRRHAEEPRRPRLPQPTGFSMLPFLSGG